MATGTSMTDYLEDALLNEVFRATNFASPTTVYVALFTAAPSDAGGGTEVTTSGTAYARQAVTFGAPSGGIVSNSAQVAFAVATGSYGTVTHCAIFDAVTAGNMLVWAALTSSKTIGSGDQFVFNAAQLTCQFD